MIVGAIPNAAHEDIPAARLGFGAAIATAVLAVVAFARAVTTLPISGPLCVVDCVDYPFSDVAAYVPHDYIWMYPAMLLMIASIVLFVALHASTPPARRVFGQAALTFTAISAGLILIDYYMQVAVMQPSILRGESEGLALLTQYNAHGVFIALEDMGYFIMGIAFLFAALVFAGRKGLERALFWVLLTGGLAAVAGYFIFYAIYGTNLEYRYEILSLTIDWATLCVSGALLAFWFRRRLRAAKHTTASSTPIR